MKNIAPPKKNNNASGSALVILVAVMSILLAYSACALQSSVALRNFAVSRAEILMQQQYLDTAYRYSYMFCSRYHNQLHKEEHPIQLVLESEDIQLPWRLCIEIIPQETYYQVNLSLNKAHRATVSEQRVIHYTSLSKRES